MTAVNMNPINGYDENGVLHAVSVAKSKGVKSLKSIAEHPFHNVHINPAHPYYQDNRQWCEDVQNWGCDVRGYYFYQERMKEIGRQLALGENCELLVSKFAKEHLDKIDQAVVRMVEEKNQQDTDSFVIHAAVKTICEGCFQLLMRPVNKILRYHPLPYQDAMAIAAEQKRIEKEVKSYLERDEICCGFQQIFRHCPKLREVQCGMLQSSFTLVSEMPNGFRVQKIDDPSYFPDLLRLIQGIEDVTYLKGYLANRERVKHFQKTLEPLVYLLQCLKKILLWPGVYELDKKEFEFLEKPFRELMAISNEELPEGRRFVPFEYMFISEDTQKEAIKKLKNKQTSREDKIQAKRSLLHACIPWKALYAIGTLLHEAGGVQDAIYQANKQLFLDALPDVIQELPTVASALEELIAFEATVFSAMIDLTVPKRVPEGSFKQISQLGNWHAARKYTHQIVETLNYWRNLPLTADQLASPAVRYGLLRCIQVVGELAKHLRQMGMLEPNPIWSCLEKLRDLLAHPEIVPIHYRLERLIDGTDLNGKRIFDQILVDLGEIHTYFFQCERWLQDMRTWSAIKNQSEVQTPCTITATGLQDLKIALCQKISDTLFNELIDLLKTAAENGRRRINDVVSEISLHLYNESSYRHNVDLLPLSMSDKNCILKAIKILLSRNAAENDCRTSKPGMLKKVLNIIETCKKQETDTLKSKVLECQENLELPTFNDKLSEAQLRYQELCLFWTGDQAQLQSMGNLLQTVGETVDDYVQRKKEQLEKIVGKVPTFQHFSEVELRAKDLIRKIQLDRPNKKEFLKKNEKFPPTKEEFLLEIAALGIRCQTNRQLWEKAYASCKNEYCSLGTPPDSLDKQDHNKTLIADTKRKSLIYIDLILKRLQLIDHLLPKDTHAFKHDHRLQHTCQYLCSNFRSFASSLEVCLETLRHLAPQHRQFFLETKQALNGSIARGNAFLHLHEVTEPGITTSTGHIVFFHQYLLSLIVNFTAGKNRDVTIDSLALNLQNLKQALI